MVSRCISMEFPSTSTEASTNLHRRDSTSWKLPPTSMQVIYLHGMEFGGSWRKLPWKQMEAPPSICFHGSIYTSTYFHGSTMSVYFRGGFQPLPSASICYHLIPRKLPPTFMEVGRLPACLYDGQLPWKWLQLPRKEQTRSKNFRLPKKTHDYVEPNGSRSNSIWMLVEVAGKLDGSYTTSVEVGASKGK